MLSKFKILKVKLSQIFTFLSFKKLFFLPQLLETEKNIITIIRITDLHLIIKILKIPSL